MKNRMILVGAFVMLACAAAAYAQQPEELPDLKRDEDWTKQFMTRDQAEDLLEPFELAAFGKITDVAGAADELGAKIVGENRSARLTGGQRVLCKVALTDQGKEVARGARFTVTTRAKTFFTNLYKNFFQIHYAEGVGEGTSLADVIVKNTSTRGRPFLMIHPAGDDRFYFTFTANTDGKGAIRSHIEPTFFKKTDGPVIITGDPIPIATCCIDVKETIGRVPKFRGVSISISISSLWGKVRISILFKGLLRKCLAWKVKKIRDAHQNDECKPFEVPDVIIVLSGENLPTGVSPNDIQIGGPGECQVTKVLQSSETSCTVKAKLLKHEPGLKDVQMTTAAGETIIAEDILEFTRIMTISPECIDYGEEQFTAIVTMDSESGLEFDNFTDGEFLTFADERAQAFNLTPTLRKSDTELETITSGGELNAATMVIEGFCPGAGMVKACPRNWAIEFPDGLPPGEFELPEDFQPCCGSEVKVLPVFTVEPAVLVAACVTIQSELPPVPDVEIGASGNHNWSSRRKFKRDLFAKLKGNTDDFVDAPGILAREQKIVLVGKKLPTDINSDDLTVGEPGSFDTLLLSASSERLEFLVRPTEDCVLGLKGVLLDFLQKEVAAKNEVSIVKVINDVPRAASGEEFFVGARLHSTNEALAAIPTGTSFEYRVDGTVIVPGDPFKQGLLNLTQVDVTSENEVSATFTKTLPPQLTFILERIADTEFGQIEEFAFDSLLCEKTQCPPLSLNVRLFKPRHDRGAGFVLIPEADEQAPGPGGLTVFNGNDSDSNGENDALQSVIDAGDEKDLMRMIIDVVGAAPTDLVLISGDAEAQNWVQMWPTEDKNPATTPLVAPIVPGAAGSEPVIAVADLAPLFIEGIQISGMLRDVTVTVSVTSGTPAVTVSDTFNLTFVFAGFDQGQVKHNNGDAAWADITNPPNALLIQGTPPAAQLFGLRARVPIGGTPFYQNQIGLQVTVLPPGVGAVPGVAFDIARDKETFSFIADLTGAGATNTARFMQDDEVPNDDAGESDESNAPNAMNHMFVVDNPRQQGDPVRGPGGNQELLLRVLNFREWVRVRFDGTAPSGNAENGSRCSSKFRWHARILMQHRAPGGAHRWVRVNTTSGTTLLTETVMGGLGNDIGPGRVPIPTGVAVTLLTDAGFAGITVTGQRDDEVPGP